MNPNTPHVLYRCYDAAGRLLYIGCTHDINLRMDVHRSSWSNPVSGVLNMRMERYEVSDKYPSKATGRAAERQAIYDEEPLLNLHHQRVRRSPAERRVLIDEYLEATRVEPDPAIAARLEALGDLFAGRTALARTG